MSVSEQRIRSHVLGVRLSPNERAMVDAQAAALGISVPELVRRLLLDPPRLAPGDVVYVVGPNRNYRITGLATKGKDASLDLETVGGGDWIDGKVYP